MTLQTIIDTAQSIQFSRRKLVGQTMTRSGMLRTGTVASKVPWQITVAPTPGLHISAPGTRQLLEHLDLIDRAITETINIGGSNPGLAYLTRYQGGLTNNQRAGLSWLGANILNQQIGLPGNLPVGTRVFAKGDIFSLGTGYKYPYTVTADVVTTVTNQESVTVPASRPFINQTDFPPTGSNIRTGSEVTWNMIIGQRPSYTVVPGGRVEFSGDFQLIEVIED